MAHTLPKEDVKSGFLHTPIHQSHVRLVAFMHPIEGRLYGYTRTPFGMHTSLSQFARVFRPVVQQAQLRGVALDDYVDDTVRAARSLALGAAHKQILYDECEKFGIRFR